MDAIAKMRGRDELVGDYEEFINHELHWIDSTPGADNEGQSAMWELTRTLLLLDEKQHYWTPNKLQRRLL